MDERDREKELAETQFAATLLQQIGEVTVNAARPHKSRRLLVAIAVGAAAAAVLGGVALAGGFSPDESNVPAPPIPARSAYPTNAKGQTYGSDKALIGEPDLVAVMATNGEKGYCLKEELNGAPTSPVGSQTPEESQARMDASLRGRIIPVYKSDGVTKIGVFQVGGPGTTATFGDPYGNRITKTVDDDNNIVTETEHPDGTVTVAIKGLNGMTTTKTLTASEAASIEEKTASAPRVTQKPEEPPAWLLVRMSSLARQSGDVHATARWEFQTRYYLKPIEGDKAPESPYQQWVPVWLVILHGDFKGGDWKYWLLGPDSHAIISEGTSETPFDTSSHDLQPMPGPITLGE